MVSEIHLRGSFFLLITPWSPVDRWNITQRFRSAKVRDTSWASSSARAETDAAGGLDAGDSPTSWNFFALHFSPPPPTGSVTRWPRESRNSELLISS